MNEPVRLLSDSNESRCGTCGGPLGDCVCFVHTGTHAPKSTILPPRKPDPEFIATDPPAYIGPPKKGDDVSIRIGPLQAGDPWECKRCKDKDETIKALGGLVHQLETELTRLRARENAC